MSARLYVPNCEGCEISHGCGEVSKDVRRRGGAIELDGEGFLGWLALQPRYHRMELSDLGTDEAAAFGRNIQDIDIALRQYWSIHFEDDPIERVYAVYFFEGVYDRPCPTPYHLHIHLIPRTKQFDPLLRRATEDGSTIVAWNIYKLTEKEMGDRFPPKYRVDNEDQKMVNLMTYLGGYLRKPSVGN
jgi:diadenosine tetraphosphate (Ap4A) HIT family hydrolase